MSSCYLLIQLVESSSPPRKWFQPRQDSAAQFTIRPVWPKMCWKGDGRDPKNTQHCLFLKRTFIIIEDLINIESEVIPYFTYINSGYFSQISHDRLTLLQSILSIELNFEIGVDVMITIFAIFTNFLRFSWKLLLRSTFWRIQQCFAFKTAFFSHF
jgi:hypothetical protein